jgi:hypothetical protein
MFFHVAGSDTTCRQCTSFGLFFFIGNASTLGKQIYHLLLNIYMDRNILVIAGYALSALITSIMLGTFRFCPEFFLEPGDNHVHLDYLVDEMIRIPWIAIQDLRYIAWNIKRLCRREGMGAPQMAPVIKF